MVDITVTLSYDVDDYIDITLLGNVSCLDLQVYRCNCTYTNVPCFTITILQLLTFHSHKQIHHLIAMHFCKQLCIKKQNCTANELHLSFTHFQTNARSRFLSHEAVGGLCGKWCLLSGKYFTFVHRGLNNQHKMIVPCSCVKGAVYSIRTVCQSIK